jgi:hypothetical protein
MDWLKLSQMFQHTMIGLGVIIGGLWAYYQWRSQRAHATALEIGLLATTTQRQDGRFLVFFDVSLENIGRRKLVAKRKQNGAGSPKPVYTDDVEELYHSLGLQIESIPKNLGDLGPNWYPKELAPLENIPMEINLLYDYQFSITGEENFYMEPGETYHLGYPVELTPGDYLAKVTFVGAAGEEEFWRRRFYVHVPGGIE